MLQFVEKHRWKAGGDFLCNPIALQRHNSNSRFSFAAIFHLKMPQFING